MERYDFDKQVDRCKTNCLKYDFAVERGKPEGVLPLWVADMDFPTARPIIDRLHQVVEHGIFGYSDVKSDYYRAAADWFKTRFGWDTEEKWLVKTPGVVFALAAAVRGFTEPGDAVLIQPPVYYPFFEVVKNNGRELIESQLINNNGHYEIDFRDFEEKIRENNVKLFILCSPHNPVGRVWTRQELRQVGKICEKYGVIVVSDEIHCDFAFPGHPHTIFADACPELKERSVICTSTSKTFNMAGLQVSNIWIPGDELRREFCREIERTGYSQLNSVGLAAAQAAYEAGGEWLEECRDYLRSNLDYLRRYLSARLPEIKLIEPEGTYFAWLDFSALGLSKNELSDLVVKKANLWLDDGHVFGGNSDAFQRIALGCTRETLQKALSQLEQAVKEYRKAA